MDKKEFTFLNKIQYPEDLRKLPVDELPQVCEELREDIVQEVAVNPGHLASSLGVVEITVALHYVFNTPDDRIVWDVGHQAYGHKILTGVARSSVQTGSWVASNLSPHPLKANTIRLPADTPATLYRQR